jgi:hypothetical protein
MTLEQTVEIPENRKVQFSTEVPVGRFRIVFFPETPEPKNDPYAWRKLSSTEPGTQVVKPLRSLRGIDKDRDTMEAYFKRHHADNDRERELDRQKRGQ